MFKIRDGYPVIPSQLTLSMDGTLACVSSIALWLGSDDGGWLKICDNITSIGQYSSTQSFSLKQKMSGKKLLQKRLNLLLVEVLEVPKPPAANPNVEYRQDDYTKVDPGWNKLISFGLKGARYVGFYELFQDAFGVDDKGNIIYQKNTKRVCDDDMKQSEELESNLKIMSHFAFTVTFGDDDPDYNEQFTFKNLSDLSIPLLKSLCSILRICLCIVV